MSTPSARIGQFIEAGVAAQLAVDRAIERAELVRLVRDRGSQVRELSGVDPESRDAAWRERWEEARDAHFRACAQLDEFDHAGRAPA